MKMKKDIVRLITFGLVFLAGCISRSPTAIPTEETEQETSTPPLSIIASISPTPLNFVTNSPMPTNTPPAEIVPSAYLSTPTESPSIPPEPLLKKECLEVLPDVPSEAVVNGKIILDSRVDINGLYSYETFLLDKANGTMTKIAKPNENLVYFAVSPDRQQLAYSSSLFDKPGGKIIEDRLVISDADGTETKSLQWENGWGNLAGWLDDQKLVINIAGLDPDESTALKAASLMILNPFTGERRVLHPDFPDIYDMPSVPDWDGWGETMYDPTLTRVVYPRWIDSGTYEYTLWDLRGEEVLNTFLFTFFPIPRWSPDGLRFVVAGYLVPQGY
jgi:hypothetical protein